MTIENDIGNLKRHISVGSFGHIEDHQKIANILEQLKIMYDGNLPMTEEELEGVIIDWLENNSNITISEMINDEINSRNLVINDDARLPSLINSAHAFVLEDLDGKMPLYVDKDGHTWLQLHEDVSLNGEQISPGSISQASLKPDIITMKEELLPDNYIFIISDAIDRVGFGIKSDGTIVGNALSNSDSNSLQLPIIARGDSITEGAELTDPINERWSALLSNKIGVPIENIGSSGLRSDEITALAGAVPFTCSVSGNIIPASGSVVVTEPFPNPIRTTKTLVKVNLGGVIGNLIRSGGPTYSFNRIQAGVATPVAEVVDGYSVDGTDRLGKIHIVGFGTNDIPDIQGGTRTVQYVCRQFNSMVSSLRGSNPRYLVWGPLDRGSNEGAGTPRGNIIREIEAYLETTFGSNYVPVREYLYQRGLSEMGITPTSTDINDINAHSVPASLRYAGVHLKANGNQVVANIFEKTIRMKGWF